MSVPLFRLPAEILDLIFHCVSAEESNHTLSLVRLSSCCKSLRTLLAPLIFQHISFTEEPWSCKSALSAVQAYPQYVRSLHFTVRVLPYGWLEEAYLYDLAEEMSLARQKRLMKDPETILHSAARKLIAGACTPYATLLTVSFQMMAENSTCEPPEDPEHYDGPEEHLSRCLSWQEDCWQTQEFCRRTETDFVWLARLAAIHRSIATNTQLRHLKMINALPRASTVLFEPAWDDFLCQLKRFEVVVPLGSSDGIDNSDFSLNYVGYGPPLSEPRVLKSWLSYPNAQNLGYLELRGSAAYEISSSLICKLIERPDKLPHLTSLRLHTIFFDMHDMGSWLAHHAQILRSLEMYNCWCRWYYGYPHDRRQIETWDRMFSVYADADQKGTIALERINVWAGDCEDPDLEMPFHTPQAGEWPWHKEPGRRLSNIKGRRFGPPVSFLYGSYGTPPVTADNAAEYGWGSHVEPDETLDAWQRRESFHGYRRLVEIIQRNSARRLKDDT